MAPKNEFKAADFTWTIAKCAKEADDKIRRELSAERYKSAKHGLQEMLLGYINLGDLSCEMGGSVSPIGADGDEHYYKVRFALPGSNRGRSHGLRLGVSINLVGMQVRIAYIAMRRDEPAVEDMLRALKGS